MMNALLIPFILQSSWKIFYLAIISSQRDNAAGSRVSFEKNNVFLKVHLDESYAHRDAATSFPSGCGERNENSISEAEKVYSSQHSIVHLSAQRSINVACQI